MTNQTNTKVLGFFGENPYNKSAEWIELQQESEGSFAVVYGGSVKTGLTHDQAAKELGYCLMHHAQCEGLINIGE